MESEEPFDTGLGLEDSHVVVTGAAGAIGSVMVYVYRRRTPDERGADPVCTGKLFWPPDVWSQP